MFSALWGSVISIIIFIYLLMPNVRKAFGTAGDSTEAIEPAAPAQPSVPMEPPPPADTPETATTPAPGEDSEQ